MLLTAALATALLAGSGPGRRHRSARGPSKPRPPARRAAAVAAPVKVVAVGDIACPARDTVTSNCRQAATARLTRGIDPAYVIGLGDLQYDCGTLARSAAPTTAPGGA